MSAPATQTAPATHPAASAEVIGHYSENLLGVFGAPQLAFDHGDGAWLWDIDGNRYLDLLSGLGVNALGHGHPALVSAVSKQIAEIAHIANFWTTRAQVELAAKVLTVLGAPDGSRVFLANSGAEAIEAAIKLSRRTGRAGLVALEGAFHGRTTGALALTHKAAYREPFTPLLPEVAHVPAGDISALDDAVTEQTAAVFIEPIQGEQGVIELSDEFLLAAREITSAAGALLIIDEIQTGIGRTGDWFAHQRSGVIPDAVTLAKGLAGGLPIGALVTYGERVSSLLGPGQHGTTFGGNPLVSAAALSVLEAIEREGLVAAAGERGAQLEHAISAMGHPVVTGVRGRGLMRAITLDGVHAVEVAAAARTAGFLINPVAPDAIRLLPPLIISEDQIDQFVRALPAILDLAEPKESS